MKPEALLFPSVINNLITPKLEREICAQAKRINREKLQRTGIRNIINRVTGFEAIVTDRACGGYCDLIRHVIAIRRDSTDPARVMTHEIGHFIQVTVGIDYDFSTISEQVRFEQQCETISYHLYNKIFPSRPPHEFIAYFKKEDAEFLFNWYYGEKQDDLGLIKI